MKLTFRTIKGTTFNLDAEPTTSVGDLKAALEAAQGPSMPKDLVKLVYKGKVLEDNSKAISEYSVDESGFLVVFVQKAPAAKPAAATGNTSSAPPAAAEVGAACMASNCCMQSICV
jgi:UV excision repair protein RAD23